MSSLQEKAKENGSRKGGTDVNMYSAGKGERNGTTPRRVRVETGSTGEMTATKTEIFV